jgi:hypothetical protein
VVSDEALSELPDDAAVWVLGWDNRWAGRAATRLAVDGLDVAAATARLDGLAVTRQQHAVVLAAPDGDPAPLGFIGAEGAPVIAALARKLPHYTRYGRLVFAGEAAENVFKDERQSAKSALTHVFTAADVPRAPLPPGPILAPQAAGH